MSARRVGLVAYLLLAAGLVAWAVGTKPDRYGDGHEYLLMTEALTRHRDPALTPDVLDAVQVATQKQGIDFVSPPDSGFFLAHNARRYSWHFWAYPLSAVPARVWLEWVGGDPLRALQLTNVGWYLLAVGVAGFAGVGPPVRRAGYLLLTCVGPAVWYLPFTGAEVFTWTLVVSAFVFLDRRQYAVAAFAAGLGATQNPLAALFVAAVVGASLREWSARITLTAAVAGSVCLAAPTFYWWHFGVPSLIAADPHLNSGRVTWAKSLGLLADPNYGLLPFAPGLVLLAAAGLWPSLRRQPLVTATLLGAMAVAGLLAQGMIHWNGAAMGPHRYLLWLSPPLAWVAANGLAARPRLGWAALGLAVVVQAGILVAAAPERLDYIRPNALARFIWRKAPWLNDPDPQVFLVRNTGCEKPAAEFKPPVGFVARYGVVTKLLLTPETVPLLPVRFHVDPAYLAEVERAAAGRTGFFYLHPPKDAVRCWPGHDGKPPE